MRGKTAGYVQRASFVGGVLENNVALLILVFAKRDKNNVAVIDPNLFPKFATNKAEPLDTVEALCDGTSDKRLVLVDGASQCGIPWLPTCRSRASSKPEHTLDRPP